MYPRAIAKRKICKIGRACGLGCVPKSHNCKRPLKHQAKTAAQWLAHVTANTNYEAEVNLKTDKRLERFNRKVKSHEGRLGQNNTSTERSIESRKEKTIELTEKSKQILSDYLKARDNGSFDLDIIFDNAENDEQLSELLSVAAKLGKRRRKKEGSPVHKKQNQSYTSLIDLGKNFISSETKDLLKSSIAEEIKQLIEDHIDAIAERRDRYMEGLRKIADENLDKDTRQQKLLRLEAVLQKKEASIEFNLSQKLKAVETAMQSIRDRLIKESRITEKESQSMAQKIKFEKSIDKVKRGKKHDQDKIRQDIAEFFRLTGGMGGNSFFILKMSENRGHAARNGVINIGEPRGEQQTKRTLFHEIGHHVEFESSDVYQSAVEWIKSRSKSDQPINLNTLPSLSSYDDNEIAYPDEFIDPYVGKVYSDATEVISMGLERFSSPTDMSNFFVSDPEHFYFTVGVLRKKNV